VSLDIAYTDLYVEYNHSLCLVSARRGEIFARDFYVALENQCIPDFPRIVSAKLLAVYPFGKNATKQLMEICIKNAQSAWCVL